MPEVRQLRKPPASSQIKQGDPVPTPPVVREERAPTVKKFPNGALQLSGHDYCNLTISAPADMTFENALIPEAWVHASRKVAMDASKRREWTGSTITLYGPDAKWRAEFQIMAIVYDKFKQPCGLNVMCIGPSMDPKTGKAMPIDLKTGLPWVDPKEDEAEAA